MCVARAKEEVKMGRGAGESVNRRQEAGKSILETRTVGAKVLRQRQGWRRTQHRTMVSMRLKLSCGSRSNTL